MSNNLILYEILPYKINKLLILISKLIGHKSYSDNIKNNIEIIENNEYIYFDEEDFLKSVARNMKQNNIYFLFKNTHFIIIFIILLILIICICKILWNTIINYKCKV